MSLIPYIDELLAPFERPYAGAIGVNFMLIDDSARHPPEAILKRQNQPNTFHELKIVIVVE